MTGMRYRVSIRFDQASGTFEEFLVEAVDGQATGPAHDEAHERIARQFADAVEAGAGVIEVPPGPDQNGEGVAPLRAPGDIEGEGETTAGDRDSA